MPDIQDQVDLFEKKYPEINVKVENVGQGLDHYAEGAHRLEGRQRLPTWSSSSTSSSRRSR